MTSASRIAAMALMVSGCTTTTIVVTPDTGIVVRDAGAVDAAIERDAGPPTEPNGGSECDQQDDCSACLSCSYAPSQPCNALALQCEDEPPCLALVQCLNGCGAEDRACVRGCGAAHPDGTTLLRSFYACAYCTACTADCRAYGATWCESPPF